MSEDAPRPREPQHLYQTAEDSLSTSDSATRQVDAFRSAEDTVQLSDSVHAMVGQAQALVATAVGQANDASVRIEEFGASAETDSQRTLAGRLAADNDAMKEHLASIDRTLKSIEAKNDEGGISATRYNRAFVVFGVVGCIVGIVGIAVALLK